MRSAFQNRTEKKQERTIPLGCCVPVTRSLAWAFSLRLLFCRKPHYEALGRRGREGQQLKYSCLITLACFSSCGRNAEPSSSVGAGQGRERQPPGGEIIREQTKVFVVISKTFCYFSDFLSQWGQVQMPFPLAPLTVCPRCGRWKSFHL